MNVFLTGEKRIGKSTILKRVLQDYQGEVCGFYTLPVSGRREYVLKDVCSNESQAICRSEGHLVGVPEAFEDLGVRILKRCLEEGSDLIVMDELGRFEREAYQFKKQVLACLDSDIPVLGVIQKETEWLKDIGTRKDTVVLTVAEDNREEIYLKIKKIQVYG